MELYDMHSHILPQMDDGAEDVEVSKKILNVLYSQGVSHICLTPHYYSHKESMEDFLKRREYCLSLLKPHIPQEIKVCLGAEVYVTDIIMNNASLNHVCYGNSNYILLEFPYLTTFKDSSFELLVRLMNRYGVKPILAHIERYPALLGNPKLMQELSSYGIRFQTNVVLYLDRGTFRKLKKLIKLGLVDFIGSDAHNLVRNSPQKFGEAVELINKKTSPNVMRAISRFSSDVFSESTES